MNKYEVLVFERSSLGDLVETISKNLTMEKALNVVQSMTGERFDAHEVVKEFSSKGSFTTREREIEYSEYPAYWRLRGYQIIKEESA